MIIRFMLLFFVLLGYLLKRLGIFKKKTGDLIVTAVFYFFLPLAIFNSLVRVELEVGFLVLVISGFAISLACYAFAYSIRRFLHMGRRTEGSFLIACGGMNMGLFTYPHFLLYLGTAGLAHVVFFDMGHSILLLSLAYYIACRYGENKPGFGYIARRIAKFPLAWAFLLALSLSYMGYVQFIDGIMSLMSLISGLSSPLIMLSLGIFVEPRISKLKPTVLILFTKFVFALGIAAILVKVLGLEGIFRTTVLVASTAPVAMLTLVYSVEEKLDVEFTASVISVSILIGLVYMPLLFWILG